MPRGKGWRSAWRNRRPGDAGCLTKPHSQVPPPQSGGKLVVPLKTSPSTMEDDGILWKSNPESYILWYMKAISLNVSENSYRKFQEIAERQGLPVSELIRRAMDEFLDRHYSARGSVLDLPAFASGGILRHWKGADLYEEMTRR